MRESGAGFLRMLDGRVSGRRRRGSRVSGVAVIGAVIAAVIAFFSSGDFFGGSDTGVVESEEVESVEVESVEAEGELGELLSGLEVVEVSNVDKYDRGDWKHWVGSPCNTRQEVLIKQGEGVTTGDNCKIVSGKWVDPYSLEVFTNSSDLDIDHLIPLSYASRVGGYEWDKDKKEEFANDYDHLLAVSARENRVKGDKGPSEYLPPNEDYWCEYSEIWITTSDKYGLGITLEDKEVLEEIIRDC